MTFAEMSADQSGPMAASEIPTRGERFSRWLRRDLTETGPGKGENWGKRLLRWLWLYIWPCHFPRLQPVLTGEDEEKAKDEGVKQQQLLAALSARSDVEISATVCRLSTLHEDEERRKKSADGRLASVIGLASIISAITLGFSFEAFAKGSLRSMGWWGYLVAAGTVLSVFQLFLAVRAALKGLDVKRFLETSADEAIASQGESERLRGLREAEELLKCLSTHDGNINDKMDQVSIAHRALLNFLVTLFGLLIVLTGLALRNSPKQATTEEQVLEILKKDARVVDMLRGARGDVGPQGEKGDPGLQGPPGERCIKAR